MLYKNKIENKLQLKNKSTTTECKIIIVSTDARQLQHSQHSRSSKDDIPSIIIIQMHNTIAYTDIPIHPSIYIKK